MSVSRAARLQMGMGGGIGFMVGGAGGAMFGAYEIMRCVYFCRCSHGVYADHGYSFLQDPRSAVQPARRLRRCVAAQTSQLRAGARSLSHIMARGITGNRILTMGGGFGFFLAVGSGFWCARSIRR